MFCTGVNVLFSGGVDEFDFGTAYSVLIRAFVSTLILHQPLYPSPPDTKVYIGEYVMAFGSTNITATVVEYKSQLLLSTQGQAVFLAYREQLMFQVYTLTYNPSICKYT